MTITRMGISSLMGYQEGGGVIDETMQDNLVDETNKKQIENKDMSFLQNLLGQNDMNFQFKQYSDMLSKIASPRPAASGYDLASALGRGLLAQQSEKFPSVGRGLGLGFQEFSKLQKEIDEENRKNKQARDMTAFGLVANRKAKQEPSGKVMEMFVNDDQQFYKSILVGNEVKFIGPEGEFTIEEFYDKFKGTNMRPTIGSEAGRYVPNYPQFAEAYKEMNEERRSLASLQSYVQNRVQAGQGIDFFANDMIALMKTLSGDPEAQGLSPEELAVRMSQGKFQGLIGKFRLEVVGPGVMTEYDAQRIIMALGAEPSALQNVTAMKNIMRDIFSKKYEKYLETTKTYNLGALSGKYPGYEAEVPIEYDNSIFDFNFDAMRPPEVEVEQKNDEFQIWVYPNGDRRKFFKTGAVLDLQPKSDKDLKKLEDL